MYTFGEIRGNGRLTRQLQRAVQEKKVSHAYLFIGGRGLGKRRIADTFAKYLLCENPLVKEGEPCGECKSCHVFDSGNHPDVLRVTTEKKTLGVEEIREQILETIDLKPYSFAKKVYIIENAHTMTAQGQNALLKTLEEPPAYGVFLLLAEREEAFLPTILSRTVTMRLNPLGEGEVAAYLQEEKGISPADGAVLAAYAQGSIGQALEILEDEEFQRMREEILDKMRRLPAMPLGQALCLAKEWEGYKNDPRFLDMMGLWYRDLMVAKSLREERFLIQKDKKELIFDSTAEPLPLLAKKAAAVQTAKERLAQNANFRLTLEVLLMELKENGNQ